MTTPLQMVKRAKAAKPKAAIGKLGRLDAGSHKVVIKKVLVQDYLTKGYVEVCVEDVTGASHRERLWPVDQKDPSVFHPKFVDLVNAVFADPDIYDVIESVSGDPNLEHVFYRALEGTELQIVIEQSHGVTPEAAEGGWILREYPSGAVWSDDQGRPVRFAGYKDVAALIAAEGLRKSFGRVIDFSCVNDATADNNRRRFDANILGMSDAAKQLGDTRKLFNPDVFR